MRFMSLVESELYLIVHNNVSVIADIYSRHLLNPNILQLFNFIIYIHSYRHFRIYIKVIIFIEVAKKSSL